MDKYAQLVHGMCLESGKMLLTQLTYDVMANVRILVEKGSICGELAAA